MRRLTPIESGLARESLRCFPPSLSPAIREFQPFGTRPLIQGGVFSRCPSLPPTRVWELGSMRAVGARGPSHGHCHISCEPGWRLRPEVKLPGGSLTPQGRHKFNNKGCTRTAGKPQISPPNISGTRAVGKPQISPPNISGTRTVGKPHSQPALIRRLAQAAMPGSFRGQLRPSATCFRFISSETSTHRTHSESHIDTH